MALSIFSISFGAALGALLRWFFGILFNPLFPTLPLGTLAANLLGGFLMGLFLGISQHHHLIPAAAQLAITTGFLGGLTTFSTFSAETVTLLSEGEYFWMSAIVIGHVGGSLIATLLGLFLGKALPT